MIEILKVTGFKTPSEYYSECSDYDKLFISRAMEKYNEKYNKKIG